MQQVQIAPATLWWIFMQHFLWVAGRETNKRFDFDDALLTHIVCLHLPLRPTRGHEHSVPLWFHSCSSYHGWLTWKTQTISKPFVDQWRHLFMTLSEDTKTMDMNVFWHHLSTLVDFGGKRCWVNWESLPLMQSWFPIRMLRVCHHISKVSKELRRICLIQAINHDCVPWQHQICTVKGLP